MFNLLSDPWYTYMQPFRIVFLKKMIKAQHDASKAQPDVSKAQPDVSKVQQEPTKNEETSNP